MPYSLIQCFSKKCLGTICIKSGMCTKNAESQTKLIKSKFRIKIPRFHLEQTPQVILSTQRNANCLNKMPSCDLFVSKVRDGR